jgi:hypothetical protein
VITKPTVLVLGAGASKPYGFPTAPELIDRVLKSIEDDARTRARLQKAAGGYGDEEIKEFADKLKKFKEQDPSASIEDFLASQDNYFRLGRSVIAQAILECEHDNALSCGGPGAWYHLLVARLWSGQPSVDQLELNQLKIITFNFDRSLERAIDRHLIGTFGESESEGLWQKIPILHVHGQLGRYSRHSDESCECRRLYRPETSAIEVERWSFALRLATDKDFRLQHERRKEQARQWLCSAERVCFLGFGYGEENLKTLGFPEVLDDKDKHSVWGTCYQCGGILEKLRERTKERIQFADPNVDIAQFFQEHPELFQ